LPHHRKIPFHLPIDVDFQAEVWRVWPIYCPQEVLLNCDFATTLQNLTTKISLYSMLKYK
jgi:hypothetical protein